MRRLLATILAVLLTTMLLAQVPQGFNYTALVRNADGTAMKNKQIELSVSLQNPSEEVYYSETHNVTTNSNGIISLIIGSGTPTNGDFTAVPWQNGDVLIQLEVNGKKLDNATQLQSVPYAMFSQKSAELISPNDNGGALFAVKNQKGDTVFAVYPDGVRVYVDKDNSGKAFRGGFAVATRGFGKGDEPTNVFSVTPDSTRVYVKEKGKSSRGGFAVATRGFNHKGNKDKVIFATTPDSTRIYIDDNGKSTRGGFAIAKRGWNGKGKESDQDILTVEPNHEVTVVVDDKSKSKAFRGGFAVATRGFNSHSKADDSVKTVFTTNADSTRVYINNNGKSTRGGFAIAKRGWNGKGTDKENDIFTVEPNHEVTVVVDDKSKSKAFRGGFAVATRGFNSHSKADDSVKTVFTTNADSTRVYINNNGKSTRGGFAIAKRGWNGKGTDKENDIFTVEPNHEVTVVVDDKSKSKAFRGGFAVATRGFNSHSKGDDEGKTIFATNADSTRVYIKKESKALRGGFAIATRGWNGKGENKNNDLLFMDNNKTTFNLEQSSQGFLIEQVNIAQSGTSALATAELFEVEPSGNVNAKGVYGSAVSKDVEKIQIDPEGHLVPNLCVDTAKLHLGADEIAYVAITSGNGSYDVKSLAPAVASVELKNDTLVIKGLSIGETAISITDPIAQQTRIIEVKVTSDSPDLKIKTNKIIIARKEHFDIEILSGSGKYTVRSDNTAIATGSMSAYYIARITGTGEGNTIIHIIDKVTHQTKKVEVTVGPAIDDKLLVIDISSATIEKGKNYTISILNGSGDYKAESSDSGIAEASISGTNININAKAEGNATITVTDNKTGQYHNIDINVVVIPEALTIENGIVKKCDNSKIPTDGNIVIPSYVTSIGEEAFRSCNKLKSVTIPKTVTRILRNAFAGCTNLSSVELPNTITKIEDYVFDNCSSLSSVIIPTSVKQIGYYAFRDCRALKQIHIPNSITSIKPGAFSNSGLISITIPNSITRIESRVFEYCRSLSTVNLKEAKSLTQIGQGAFSTCDALTKIEIPNSVTRIENNAFAISGLQEIIIPNSITKLESSVFERCPQLTSVTIPSSVTSIGGQAFSGCTALSTIEIPNSVKSIGYDVFRECTQLQFITMPGVTSIGEKAFWKCSSLQEIKIPEGVVSIEQMTFTACTSLSSVTIPNSVTEIKSWVFKGCSTLQKITIPSNVTSIGARAFSDCSVLELITCLAPTPPTLNGLGYAGTVKVPKGSKTAYEAAEGWKNCTIVEME